MTAKRKPALKFSDWVKVMIVLVAALGGWYYVYSVYTEPFDLVSEIRRQQMVQEYESTSALVRPIPYGGSGRPAELRQPAQPEIINRAAR